MGVRTGGEVSANPLKKKHINRRARREKQMMTNLHGRKGAMLELKVDLIAPFLFYFGKRN